MSVILSLLLAGLDLPVGPEGAWNVRPPGRPGAQAQSIVLSVVEITVNENGSGVVNVRLAVDPGAGVVVNLHSAWINGDPSVSATPSPLVFTGGAAGTWDDDQALAIHAADDADLLDEGATVNISGLSIPVRSITVTTLDDDRAGTVPTALILGPKHGAVVFGATADFYGNGTDDVAPTQAEFFVDGVSIGADVHGGGHYHVGGAHGLWDTTGLTNGSHVLRMTVSDGTGTGSHEIIVTVQNGATGGGSSGGGCGALGVEGLLLLALLRRRRR